MRVLKLSITSFKNLKAFEVTFDASEPISVVVGRNGAGKSNLIEALTVIYRDLDAGRPTDFGYSIKYEIRGETVEISNNPKRRQRRIIAINGRRSSMAQLSGEKDGTRRLPDFVFGYYSGPTNRLQRHFERHQSSYNRALREGADLPLRRLFYARPEHSQFVLLAFFLAGTGEGVPEFLKEQLRIEGFDSALFVIGQPSWRAQGGDPTFWNARGAVADLLGELFRLSLAPLRLEVSTGSQSSGRKTREQIYLYLPDLDTLRELAARYEQSPQRLFAAFESILAAELLSDLRVRVRARGMDDSLMFRELSEGEQQLLMVLGLLRFTREDESLFLLDEPDTHLNPAWGLRYTQMLIEHSGNRLTSGQIIMASHDPLVVASLLAPQVVLLERDSETGKVSATNPDTDPRGMGVSALLTSEVYGLSSELDPVTYEKLERRRRLAASPELSEAEQGDLEQLTAELDDLDFTLSSRDPLYTRFEQAMRDVGPATELDKAPSMKRAEKEKALEILRGILAASDVETSRVALPGPTEVVPDAVD